MENVICFNVTEVIDMKKEQYEDKIVLVSSCTSTMLNDINDKYLSDGWNVVQLGNASCSAPGSVYCFVWIRRTKNNND